MRFGLFGSPAYLLFTSAGGIASIRRFAREIMPAFSAPSASPVRA